MQDLEISGPGFLVFKNKYCPDPRTYSYTGSTVSTTAFHLNHVVGRGRVEVESDDNFDQIRFASDDLERLGVNTVIQRFGRCDLPMDVGWCFTFFALHIHVAKVETKRNHTVGTNKSIISVSWSVRSTHHSSRDIIGPKVKDRYVVTYTHVNIRIYAYF